MGWNMLFRNAFRLLTENFKSVYRILLYKLIVALIASAICCALILPELIEVWNAEQTQKLLADGKAFIEALRLVMGSGQASISMLQRRFQMGYPRAASMIDKMERLGYVAPNEGSKARRVLITEEQFNEKYGDQGEF